MSFKAVRNLAPIYANELNVTITASDGDLLASLVEFTDVRDSVSCVDIDNFLDHPDVPNLENAIRITWTYVLAADWESTIIDGIEMSEESLYRKTCPHVPDRYRSVCTSAYEEICERLEVKAVNAVSMLSVLMAYLEGVQVEKFHWAVIGGWKREIASVVELYLPDWACVHICKSMRNRGGHKVPKLDTAITARSNQVTTSRVEVDCRNPVTVTFACHYVFATFHVPDFPGAVIRCSRNDLLPLVQCHAADGTRMRRDCVYCRKSVSQWLISLR